MALAVAYEGYFHTMPEVSANVAASPSSKLPFKIKNPSLLFPMRNVSFECEFESFGVKGYPRIGFFDRQGRPVDRTKSSRLVPEIEHGESSNFSCDFDKTGSIITDKGPAVASTLYMRMVVSYETKLPLYDWRRTYRSQLFVWEETSAGFQWFEGEVVR